MSKHIYSFLIEKATLSESHKQELINKRGLSDKTIAEFKFRSAGPELIHLEGLLRNSYSEQELVDSGVFVNYPKAEVSTPACINSILLQDNIIIPYLDREGLTYHVRMHKLGFSNIPVEIYASYNVKDNPSEAILTEGEFKAVAGCQWGLPTIAIPGIASFSEQHFTRLTAFLDEHKIRKVFIMFDNEIKSDPSFPKRYKDNPQNRYDTQFYAYWMGYKLDREGIETRVAVLPDSWRVDGKIDMDGAAAQGRDAGQIKKLLYDSKTHKEYVEGLSGEARAIIKRKQTQKFHKSNITREFGHYVAVRQRGKTSVTEPISNFQIKIIATHETVEGIVREIVFMDENNGCTQSFAIPPEVMMSNESFSAFCAGKGDFIWKGTLEDLKTLWESEFLLMDEGRRIIEPDHIGYVGQEKAWVFGNVAFFGTEMKEIRPDKSHVFWLEKKGIRPSPLNMMAGSHQIAEGIPYLSMKPVDSKELLQRLCDTIGEREAKIAMGWISAVPFLEDVFARYDCFPFLFITGRRGSGKSTVAEWLMNCFGLEHSGKMASETTSVAIQRFLSYYSSLPLFLDEYRNTEQIKWKTGMLRNAYNRQSAGKGMKEGFGVREAKIRGTLLLSGEETPEDSALLSRCVPIFVSEKNRVKNNYEWFQTNKHTFSYHTLNLLRNKNTLVKRFFEVFAEAKESKISNDERTLINFAVVSAGYAVAFDDKDLNFATYVVEEAKKVFAEVYDEQAVSVFFDFLNAMKTKGLVDDRYWDLTPDGKIMLYFEGLYNEWSMEYRRARGSIPFKKQAVRAYLKEESGFDQTCVNHQIKGKVKSCISFVADKAPVAIQNLVGMHDSISTTGTTGGYE